MNIYFQTDSSKSEIRSTKSISDSTKKQKKPSFVMSKSPMGAVWRSLVFPGWGQLYVERYWKAPIVTASCGFLGYLIVDNHNKYAEKRDLINILKAADPNDPQIFMEKRYREYYRDNRDMSAFYLLAVYIIAAVDCYSDAHLFDFNVDDKLSLSIIPNQAGTINLNISLKF